MSVNFDKIPRNIQRNQKKLVLQFSTTNDDEVQPVHRRYYCPAFHCKHHLSLFSFWKKKLLNLNDRFLRLRVTQKALQLPLYFFFSFSPVLLDKLVIGFYLRFSRLLLKTRVTRLFTSDTNKNSVTNIPVVLI